MTQILAATFQGGVFKPDHPPALADKARVRLVVEPVVEDNEARRRAALAALEELWRTSTLRSGGEYMTRDERNERR